MDHKSYLSTLDSATRVQLCARDNAHGLRRLAVHGGLILVLGALIALRVSFWAVLMLPQGVLIAFLFTLQHEATHRTPFASDTLNAAAGHLVGLLIFQPFLWFRYFHMAHHRHTNDPAHDPELATAKPESWGALLWYLAGPGYWWAKARVLGANAAGLNRAAYVPASARGRVQREAMLLIAVYGVLLAGTLLIVPVLIWVWLVPLAFGFPALRLYLLAEHGRCPRVADMFVNTRTTLTGRLVRFLAWNMPYHAEHHIYPAVPFHQLPALHELTQPHLQVTAPGYTAFTKEYAATLNDPG